MKEYQSRFIQLAIESGALKFGEFTLKSGRVSPYFFNAGLICSGAHAATLASCYAAAIDDAELKYDVIFGPAYKGISLAATTAVALANEYERDVPYAYNRKEAKTHGEGGSLVGAKVAGDVLIIDDVITAGTAIREVLEMVAEQKASVSAVVIGLDRQERGKGELSAIQELEQAHNLKVVSIVKLSNIIGYLNNNSEDSSVVERIEAYRKAYGIEEI